VCVCVCVCVKQCGFVKISNSVITPISSSKMLHNHKKRYITFDLHLNRVSASII